jgi:hypothetical protein
MTAVLLWAPVLAHRLAGPPPSRHVADRSICLTAFMLLKILARISEQVHRALGAEVLITYAYTHIRFGLCNNFSTAFCFLDATCKKSPLTLATYAKRPFVVNGFIHFPNNNNCTFVMLDPNKGSFIGVLNYHARHHPRFETYSRPLQLRLFP